MTSPYSERERVPVLRQAVSRKANKTPYDPRQRRALDSPAAPSPSLSRTQQLQFPRQPRSSVSEPQERTDLRSTQGGQQGIPIVRREQPQVHRQRDIDGAYGEPSAVSEQPRPSVRAQQSQRPSGSAQPLRYEDFLVTSDGSRDTVQVHRRSSRCYVFTHGTAADVVLCHRRTPSNFEGGDNNKQQSPLRHAECSSTLSSSQIVCC